MVEQDLRRHATDTPDRLAVWCDGRSWSYGELESLANRIAHVFSDAGLARGDHVAMLFGNRPEALAVARAAWRSGVYLTPMATTLTAGELGYMVSDSDARMVIVDATLAARASSVPDHVARTGVRWLSFGGAVAGHDPIEPLLAQAPGTPRADESPGALMMYTSGTTGYPKGVIRPLLPAEWVGTPPFASDLLSLFGVGGVNVRYLSTQPLYHAAALRFALAITAGGGTVFVMSKFDARTALELLVRERITHSQWVPVMFQRLLALPAEVRESFAAPDHVCAIHGAAPCTAELKRAMIDWWGPILLEYYSGSEGVGLSMVTSAQALAHPGTVGRVVKGTLHVVAADDPDRELPVGETGLLFFSGVPPFAYHKAAQKTADRTNRHGWQTLGDVGYVDTEGYVYLTDRLDDMIISGGVNVYPQEIEAVIRSVPGVVDCAVVGFADEAFGERPVAFVVHEIGEDPEQIVAVVRLHCENRLGRIKRPDRVVVVVDLPRTPTGKLLRRELRSRI
jgi:long-chain acyl-CoA synthetase